MARLVFIRHAHSTANDAGILSGQLPGVSLSKKGLKQAEDLVERIGASVFDSARVSPLQRCEETIAPWLNSRYSKGLKSYQIEDALIEMDYGSWSGRKLSSLSREKMWKEIQNRPSTVKFPDGERMRSMQKRALSSVSDAVNQKKNGTHLFVSHGDVLKAIVASLLKIKLDDFQSLVIDPASITVIDFDGSKSRLLAFNDSHSPLAPMTTMEKSTKVLLGGGSRTSQGGKR
ncbi:phoE Broad specificity phosphatase PhoE and related phosphatases [Candidatus Nanopelagicaceae bacterium]